MMPIGPLMIEHRLIERMIGLMKEELEQIRDSRRVNSRFMDTVVDFLRTYADRTHHGKEEDILFRELSKKALSGLHQKIMDELVEEHKVARKTVGSLVEANARYLQGDNKVVDDIFRLLDKLIKFYPEHIRKEDKDFFIPCMKYFSKKEQQVMLDEFWKFDREMIHEKYRKVVETLNLEWRGYNSITQSFRPLGTLFDLMIQDVYIHQEHNFNNVTKLNLDMELDNAVAWSEDVRSESPVHVKAVRIENLFTPLTALFIWAILLAAC